METNFQVNIQPTHANSLKLASTNNQINPSWDENPPMYNEEITKCHLIHQ